MHSLQKQFHDFIYANHLVKDDEKILLAVSGGLDSMVMANLFLNAGFNIELAHCNFGLRGDESDGDEAFVLKWADSNDVNCHVKAFDLGEESIQLEARNARYEWFNELLVENKLDKVATAHHLNDSLETVLINLSRGTGIKGVSGISIKQGSIIRPLLFATKAELHTYAMDTDLTWREDSSNASIDYDRNLIRHEVIPELEKLNPSLLKTFINTGERLNFASDIVADKVEQIRNQSLKQEGEGWRLGLHWISHASDELILSEILSEFGANYVTSKEVFAARGKSGKQFHVGDWSIYMDRESIFVDKNGSSSLEDIILTRVGQYRVGENDFIVEEISRNEVVFKGESVAFFDAEKLTFPLNIRPWGEGDKFNPLGMSGEKKLSDFLIDEKVPVPKKKSVLVLESNKQIAWVIGFRVSDIFKISDTTQNVIKISKSSS